MTKCCVIGCKNIGTHKFPSNPTIRRMWVKAVRINSFVPNNTTRLCREHFNENDYESVSISTGLPCAHRYLKKDSIPSIFAWNQKKITSSTQARGHRLLQRNIHKNLFSQPSTSQAQQPTNKDLDIQPSTSSFLPDFQNEIEISYSITNSENNIQDLKKTISTQTATTLSLFSTDMLLSDNESVQFYTGLESVEKFKFVFTTLLPMANNLKYRWSGVCSISTEDLFLLMLIKLRRAKPDFELSKMFGVSKTQVSNVFITWVNFVHDLWSMIDRWPTRDLVNYYMPEEFKGHSMPTRVIIDCTKIPITKPSNPKEQQISFSNYKNKNTIKFLVGSTPGALFCYCSQGFGGSVSGRQMIERSSIIDLCDEGDSVMADRGFNVQDLFASKNIGINIPTFLRGRSQLCGTALLHDRKIASQRVHIERLIGLSKTFKILTTEINTYYVALASKIFFICVMLCNFRESIMNKNINNELLVLLYYSNPYTNFI